MTEVLLISFPNRSGDDKIGKWKHVSEVSEHSLHLLLLAMF